MLNFETESSSTRKGETLVDTLRNLEAMGASLFVVRHTHSSVPASLAAAAAPASGVISAGDGHHSHPTQGLLDMLTIRQHKGEDFSRLKVAIVGDIRHSRVARSDAQALRALGVRDLRLAAPEALLPDEATPASPARSGRNHGRRARRLDVVMMLRLRCVRMDEGRSPRWRVLPRLGPVPERLALARPVPSCCIRGR